MEWFKGGVVNAISQCRQRRVLFVVYLKGTTLHTHILLYISSLVNNQINNKCLQFGFNNLDIT